MVLMVHINNIGCVQNITLCNSIQCSDELHFQHKLNIGDEHN